MVYFECCLASATNGLTILHLAGIVSYCQPDNASYWPKRKQMKEELMVNKKKKKKLASLLNSLLLITN